MFRPQINTKNLCCLYFCYSTTRSLTLDELAKFQQHLYNGLTKELSQNVNIIFSNYYLSQMCYDYDNLFEIKNEKLVVKNHVPKQEIKSQLGYIPTNLLVASCKVAKKYFNNATELT